LGYREAAMARNRVTSPEAIIASAARLFELKGYRNTTIQDIADDLGIAKPTVYAHVRSKAAVLEAIFEKVLGRLRDGLAEISHRSPDPAHEIRGMVRFIVDAAVDLRPYFLIFFGDERELEPRTRKRFRTWARDINELVEDVILRGVHTGGFSSELDPKVASQLLIGMVTSVMRWYDPRGPWSPEEVTDQIFELLGGLTPSRVSATGSAMRGTW
jgi:AcrR family transcriptional regulator